MNKILRTPTICWLICIFSVFFTGCEVQSQSPLSSLLEAKFDKRLLGKWRIEDENKNQYFDVNKVSSNEIKMSLKGENLDAEKKQSFFTAFVSEIAGNKYLNMRYINPSGVSEGYVIVKYTIKDDKLTLWILNDTKIKDALKKGMIKGEFRGAFATTKISETTGNLRSFLDSSSDSELFEYFAQFEKIKL